MQSVIVAFRSRAHTLKFSKILTANGIPNIIVNTPKQAGVGCGLSVQIKPAYFMPVKKATFAVGLSSFAGFFAVKTLYGKRIVKSI